ncbi:hypothetical protein Mal4_37380 [Maioricimonas rarisocia]|uniref:Uncharacterized protein n=1 Tax=Maioricimonas rarisocia TaxID=2528026 RepID=A0A517ZA75_9PLAN|nr:hypothetical protein [Maioricimonas rarisocia]QDU39394.1 hypothetical protein Mal4_37380 [Maioricimonas rarisocia]
MPRSGLSRLSRRTFFGSALAGLIGTGSGCGTILYPERRGQPAGKIDWTVAALNGVGMLFFFVPGIVAFAVDFATGAIYLPSDGYGQTLPEPTGRKLRTVHLPHAQPSLAEIEAAVSRETDQPVRLQPGGYQARELETLDEFWTVAEDLHDGRNAPRG